MAIKEWSTNFPAAQDIVATVQPDLSNDTDNTRVSQIHTLRDKVQSVALEVGTNPGDLPSGCLRERVATLEAGGGGGGSDRYLVWHEDAEYTTTSLSFTTIYGIRRVVRDAAKPPVIWRIVIGLWSTGTYGGRAEIQLRIGDLVTPNYDSVEILAALSGTELIYAADLEATIGSEPLDTPLGVDVTFRIDTSGDMAHVQFMDLYAILAVPPE